MVSRTPQSEIVVDGVQFKLEKCLAAYFISAVVLENGKKLKSKEVYNGFSEDFALVSFQTLGVVAKDKGPISIKIQPYKEPIVLLGEKCAAVDLGFPVTWSSCWDGSCINYRLDSPGIHDGSRSAWCAVSNDKMQWIQVYGFEQRYWTEITIQGRGDNDQRVKKFRVKSSMGGKWEDVENGKEFDGNTEKSTKVTIKFKNPILANTLRICPTEWHEHISLRFEAYFLSY